MKNPMKILVSIAAVMLLLSSCKNQMTQEGMVPASEKDSLITTLEHKDSSIMSYINTVNTIQKSIDSLRMDEKMLKMQGEKPESTADLVSEISTIGHLIIKNQRAMANLEWRLKKSNEKNSGLADLGEHLSLELNEKDSEIEATQRMLVKTRASLKSLVDQFNDSLNVIMQQRTQIGIMTLVGNTVYYICGTVKDLSDKGIIENEGGVVGLGHVPVLNGNMSTFGFTSADLNNLHEITLGGKFVKLVTAHPSDSYRITGGTPDKLIITDPGDFWSKSKFMVAIIK